MARLCTLVTRRDLDLVSLIYKFTYITEWSKQSSRPTHYNNITSLNVFKNSPYYVGATIWNEFTAEVCIVINRVSNNLLLLLTSIVTVDIICIVKLISKCLT